MAYMPILVLDKPKMLCDLSQNFEFMVQKYINSDKKNRTVKKTRVWAQALRSKLGKLTISSFKEKVH